MLTLWNRWLEHSLILTGNHEKKFGCHCSPSQVFPDETCWLTFWKLVRVREETKLETSCYLSFVVLLPEDLPNKPQICFVHFWGCFEQIPERQLPYDSKPLKLRSRDFRTGNRELRIWLANLVKAKDFRRSDLVVLGTRKRVKNILAFNWVTSALLSGRR